MQSRANIDPIKVFYGRGTNASYIVQNDYIDQNI